MSGVVVVFLRARHRCADVSVRWHRGQTALWVQVGASWICYDPATSKVIATRKASA